MFFKKYEIWNTAVRHPVQSVKYWRPYIKPWSVSAIGKDFFLTFSENKWMFFKYIIILIRITRACLRIKKRWTNKWQSVVYYMMGCNVHLALNIFWQHWFTYCFVEEHLNLEKGKEKWYIYCIQYFLTYRHTLLCIPKVQYWDQLALRYIDRQGDMQKILYTLSLIRIYKSYHPDF